MSIFNIFKKTKTTQVQEDNQASKINIFIDNHAKPTKRFKQLVNHLKYIEKQNKQESECDFFIKQFQNIYKVCLDQLIRYDNQPSKLANSKAKENIKFCLMTLANVYRHIDGELLDGYQKQNLYEIILNSIKNTGIITIKEYGFQLFLLYIQKNIEKIQTDPDKTDYLRLFLNVIDFKLIADEEKIGYEDLEQSKKIKANFGPNEG